VIPPRIAALNVQRYQLAELKPHPRNPRKHPKPGSAAWLILERSLDNDYFDPLVVNSRNGMLVSGHLRLKVMCAMGYTEADVVVVDYTEELHLARLVAANTLLGEFEDEILAALARSLDAAGVDSALAGLDEKAMMALLEAPEVTDDTDQAVELLSKADELQLKWKVEPGDLYQIGDHRLLCGACEVPEHWRMLLGDSLADLMWTDPPYNVDYQSLVQHRNDVQSDRGQGSHIVPQGILNDNMSPAKYAAMLRQWIAAGARFLKPGGAFYIAHAEIYSIETRQAARDAGLDVKQCLIWVKSAWTLGRQDYQWQHEPILCGWKPGAAHYWQGGFSQSTVIDDERDLRKLSKPELMAIINEMRNDRDSTVVRIARSAGNGLHPTIKPLPLVARQVWSSSRKGDTVLELFGGSGTTLAACQQTGRICVATELDPKYCAVILERMAAYGLSITRLHGSI